MRTWPAGTVLTSEWLIHKEGYSKGLLQQYRRSGWIELVGKGAYRRVEMNEKGQLVPLHWTGGVYALQSLSLNWRGFKPPALVAARTALVLGGYGHYVSMNDNEAVWIFSEHGYRVPTWFRKFTWGPEVKIHGPNLFVKEHPNTISIQNRGSFNIQYSCPERAMMELLELCPQKESLEHAKLLMEGLTTLRPRLVSELLEDCSSIKVKRLFLALADLCNHSWLKDIKIHKIDCGSGKRILEAGQGFHPKYAISVPRTKEG